MKSSLILIFVFLVWEVICRTFHVPSWLLPQPTQIVTALLADSSFLLQSLTFTAKVTLSAFVLALVIGLLLGSLCHISKSVSDTLYPFTILLQTTPVVSVAPLLLVWFRNDAFAALVTCAWLVCVYPMISAALSGFSQTDPNLKRLFALYGIPPWKSFWHFELPSALPLILNGVRISGGLALVGAIGAEFVVGSGGQELGLAYKLLMAAYNQETAKLFAALFVVSGFGLTIHFLLAFIERTALTRLRIARPQSAARI